MIQPQSLGDAMRLIGRYIHAGPDEGNAAGDALRQAHRQWVAAGQPEHGSPSGPVAAHQDHGLTHHSRLTDPTTSDGGAQAVEEREGNHHIIREGTHKARLLIVYGRAFHADGRSLTDLQAAEAAGLDSGGWKRCSDLRTGGWVASTDEVEGHSGVPVMACTLTAKGWARWQELDVHAPQGPMPAPPERSLFQ